MSDCVNCWNTPCTCGHEGYAIIWLPATQKRGVKIYKKYKNEFAKLEKKIKKEYKKENKID
jgi:hypothetical protein